MKKRATPKAKTSPSPRAPSVPAAKTQLLYKIVEISNVDEGSLERTLNELTPQGWRFDGVQFAMRESSKRPSMAFVFFTKEGDVVAPPRHQDEATKHLRRIADEVLAGPPAAPVPSAYERLIQLAEGGDDDDQP